MKIKVKSVIFILGFHIVVAQYAQGCPERHAGCHH